MSRHKNFCYAQDYNDTFFIHCNLSIIYNQIDEWEVMEFKK